MNGGPAFPGVQHHPGEVHDQFFGMSQHAYFSAAALQGLLLNPAIIDTLNRGAFDVLVSASITMATMLVERAK